MSAEPLETIARILEEGGEADEVLRAVVGALAEAPGVAWAAVAFLEEGRLVVGPQTGVPDEPRRATAPVTYEGAVVGELRMDGDADPQLLERVASLISPQVLVGWDTGGEDWEP